MTSKRNIVLLISYDGTAYSGWQRQQGQKTVQGKIEKALEKIHKHPVALNGSGRTDAGVHALGQQANFFTGIENMAAEHFIPALNGFLPQDIRIMGAREVPEAFHARFDARSRTYRYFFITRRAFPMEKRYALQLWRQPDIVLLNDYCRLLRGEFDCSFFSSSKDKSKSRFRYIYGASFFVEGEKLVFEIKANAFLWKMVRSLAGSLLYYEEKSLGVEALADIIASGKRKLAGPTLPPEGLFLWKIEY